MAYEGGIIISRRLPAFKGSFLPRAAKNIALSASTILLLFITSEIIVRKFYHPENLGTVVRHDEKVGWNLKPNANLRSVDFHRGFDYRISINSLGLREHEFSIQKRPGSKRILIIGDSVPFGIGVDAEWRFSDFMHRAYKGDVEVLNAAICGWGNDQELIFYESFARSLNPDIVIVTLTMSNDVINNMLGHLFLGSASKPKFILKGDSLSLVKGKPEKPEFKSNSSIKRILKRSHLLVFVKRRINEWRYRETFEVRQSTVPEGFGKEKFDSDYSFWSVYRKSYGAQFEEAWKVTEAILRRFYELCREDGAELIVFAYPLKLEVDDAWRHELLENTGVDSTLFDFHKPYERLAKLCNNEGIEFLYPFEIFKRASKSNRLYFQADSHPNKYGHALAARILLEALSDKKQLHFEIAERDMKYVITSR